MFRPESMRRLGPLLAVAALALVVAGCAAQVQPGGPPSVGGLTTASVPVSSPSGVAPPAGAVPVAGAKVDASALPAGYPRLVWTEGNGGVVGFFAEQGACTTVSASVVAQTGSTVTVRLVISEPASTKPCPQYLRNKEMTVKLDRPLGGRTVIMQAAIERG